MTRGSKRRHGSSEQWLHDVKVRPAVESLKFVPAYREQWDIVVARHGAKVVRTALRARREGRALRRGAALADDLERLEAWIPMPLAAPVDPDDPDDDGGGLRLRRGVRTALRVVDADRLRDLARFAKRLGRVPGGTRADPWLLVEVDLRQPVDVVARELRVLRRERGPIPVSRPAARGGWDRLEVGFRMLRHLRAHPETTHVELARRFLDWDPDDIGDRMPHDVARTVRALLTSARTRVEEMTGIVEVGCPSASGPFLFVEEAESQVGGS